MSGMIEPIEPHIKLGELILEVVSNLLHGCRLLTELFLKVQPDAKDTEMIKKLIQRLRQQSGGSVNP